MLAPALILSFFFGVALGQRYKFFVLLPIFALALLLAGAVALAHAEATWRIAEMTTAAIIGLQVGFALGLGLRHAALLLRAKRVRSGSILGSVPSRRTAN